MKTKRIEVSNYYSDDICQSYADWMLKRYSTLQKSVTVTATQMFHIVENGLITIERTDKQGSPIERHLVQSFSRPIGQTGSMTIEAVSVRDLYTNTGVTPIADISAIAGIAIPGRSAASKVVE